MPQKKVKTAAEKPTDVAVHKEAGVLAAIAGARDRVWYSFGAKMQVVQYESVDFSIGQASDVRADETTQAALVRIATFVHDAARQQAEQIRNMRETGVPNPVKMKKGR